MEATLLLMLTTAARKQLRPSTPAEVDAAFFSSGRNA